MVWIDYWIKDEDEEHEKFGNSNHVPVPLSSESESEILHGAEIIRNDTPWLDETMEISIDNTTMCVNIGQFKVTFETCSDALQNLKG